MVCSVLNTMCPVSDAWIGDLGRLQVADLADQDLVRVLPQDGPQAGGERQADLGVDRAPGSMPSISYSTGSSVVMILSSIVVQLVQRRVQRGRLAGRGRPGDQHDAVGLVDDLAEPRQHVLAACRSCRGRGRTTVRSSTRMTTLSPNIVGRIETRMSTGLPPMFSSMRPSCGSRRSAMSRFDMTLMRLAIAAPGAAAAAPSRTARRRTGTASCTRPRTARSGCPRPCP